MDVIFVCEVYPIQFAPVVPDSPQKSLLLDLATSSRHRYEKDRKVEYTKPTDAEGSSIISKKMGVEGLHVTFPRLRTFKLGDYQKSREVWIFEFRFSSFFFQWM